MLLRKQKDKLQTGRKYLQIIYLIRDLYPKCNKELQNLITRNQLNLYLFMTNFNLSKQVIKK